MSILKPTPAGNYLGSLFVQHNHFEGRVEGNTLYLTLTKPIFERDFYVDVHMELWEDYDINTLVIESHKYNHVGDKLFIAGINPLKDITVINKHKNWNVYIEDCINIGGSIHLENASIDFMDRIRARVDVPSGKLYGNISRLLENIKDLKKITGKGVYGFHVLTSHPDFIQDYLDKHTLLQGRSVSRIPLTEIDVSSKNVQMWLY